MKKTIANIQKKHDDIAASTELPEITYHGVILAPAENRSSKSTDNVRLVAGKDAKKLLGGLIQLYRYMVDPL
jgi:hypothetical protein